MPVEHLSVLPAILGVEEAAPDAYAHNDGAAADHNGHDDDDNARHDDGDDDDSRSRPRSNSPCDRPTPTHYSDKSWTVSPQWSSNFEHKTHKTEYSDRRLQVGDDYTARLEDRLYVDLQLFLYLHCQFTHISHIK